MGLEVVCFEEKNSVLNQYMSEIRDKNIQSDPMRFRRNLERIGSCIGYEISKKLTYSEANIVTPLGECTMQTLDSQPVIASILRAGLPMHQGLLQVFDRAENAFISAYRKHSSHEEFEIQVEYSASPSLKGKTLILGDPMLASGQSMWLCYQALVEKYGKPKNVHFASIIASEEGVNFLSAKMKRNAQLWVGAIDSELTAQSYIVPGLGDAGDLAYGEKE